jgi:GNAT superfamily N-acetyltransferase
VIARLSGQLGYASTEEEIRQRLAALGCQERTNDPGDSVNTRNSGGAVSTNDTVLVAEDADGVVGWIHGFVARRVEAEPFVEVGGLVVDDGRRGEGIGSRLLECAEAWARDNGYHKIRIRSNTVRGQTRGFYEGRGYEVTKTQWIFDKVLDDSA